MIPEEEKIIICSLMAAGASCESAAAGYRLLGDDDEAAKCDRLAHKLKKQAERMRDKPHELGHDPVTVKADD